jgi:hypothetical protein
MMLTLAYDLQETRKQLKMVLEREADGYRRHDAKLDASADQLAAEFAVHRFDCPSAIRTQYGDLAYPGAKCTCWKDVFLESLK